MFVQFLQSSVKTVLFCCHGSWYSYSLSPVPHRIFFFFFLFMSIWRTRDWAHLPPEDQNTQKVKQNAFYWTVHEKKLFSCFFWQVLFSNQKHGNKQWKKWWDFFLFHQLNWILLATVCDETFLLSVFPYTRTCAHAHTHKHMFILCSWWLPTCISLLYSAVMHIFISLQS